MTGMGRTLTRVPKKSLRGHSNVDVVRYGWFATDLSLAPTIRFRRVWRMDPALGVGGILNRFRRVQTGSWSKQEKQAVTEQGDMVRDLANHSGRGNGG
jgi:hypothetical protein